MPIIQQLEDLKLRLIARKPLFSNGFVTGYEIRTEIIDLPKDSILRDYNIEVTGAELLFNNENKNK